MNTNELLKSVEAADNPNLPEIRPGDMVKVFLRIKEGNNERIQEFRGTVIRQRSGGQAGNFTVRRVASNGIGVERTFLMRSPRIEKVVVERHANVRRAQLYFLRERTGKSANLRQKFN
jgi:large subunit ribosomal protein L19